MKAYFSSLNPREQKMIIAAAFLVLLFLPYQLIYAPFQNSLEKMQTKTTEARQNITWMNDKLLEVRKLKGSGNSSRKSKQSLLTLVETSTKQNKLNKNLRKVQPVGSSLAKIWLDDVSFDNLMRWLDNLVVVHGLSIQYIKVETQPVTGIVNARVDVSIE